MSTALARVPVRWRLAVLSGGLSAVALAVIAVAILTSFRSQVVGAVDRDLSERTQIITRRIRTAGPPALTSRAVGDALRPGGVVAEILGPGGRVLASSNAARHGPLATGASRPGSRTAIVTGIGDRTRILITRLAHGRLLAVARSLSDQDRADESLAHALILAGPITLLLVLIGAYLLAGRALRPVEELRQHAASLNGIDDDARLPVPAADDELARLAQTLNGLIDRAGEASRHERALVANASHELRSPLTRLLARLDTVAGSSSDREDLLDVLLRTRRDVRALSGIADDLLTLAVLDERERGLQMEPIDLSDLLADVVRLFAPDANAAGRSIVLTGDPVVVYANAVTLRQAIGNLLGNALVHGSGAIAVTAAESAAEIRISVGDEGPGLDLPLEAATERFRRGPAAAGRPGAGLGLALVRSVAAAHAGTLGINGPPGFTISLVLPRDPSPPARSGQGRPR